MREICPATGKQMYSRKDAGDTVRSAKKNGRNKRVPMRVYYCKACGAYHLTHYKTGFKHKLDDAYRDSTFKNRKYYNLNLTEMEEEE